MGKGGQLATETNCGTGVSLYDMFLYYDMLIQESTSSTAQCHLFPISI